jgi:hypothetical protein
VGKEKDHVSEGGIGSIPRFPTKAQVGRDLAASAPVEIV